jgi:hypothetical protein
MLEYDVTSNTYLLKRVQWVWVYWKSKHVSLMGKTKVEAAR